MLRKVQLPRELHSENLIAHFAKRKETLKKKHLRHFVDPGKKKKVSTALHFPAGK